MEFIDIIGVFLGYLCLSCIIALPTHIIMLLDDKCENKFYYLNLWRVVWNLEMFKNINISGKIIIEILYTIIFLPLVLANNIFWFIGFLMYWLIIKPFIAIFRRKEK